MRNNRSVAGGIPPLGDWVVMRAPGGVAGGQGRAGEGGSEEGFAGGVRGYDAGAGS